MKLLKKKNEPSFGEIGAIQVLIPVAIALGRGSPDMWIPRKCSQHWNLELKLQGTVPWLFSNGEPRIADGDVGKIPCLIVFKLKDRCVFFLLSEKWPWTEFFSSVGGQFLLTHSERPSGNLLASLAWILHLIPLHIIKSDSIITPFCRKTSLKG